jgi:hypothetical protein
LCFQRSRFTENYPNMILGVEPLLSQGGSITASYRPVNPTPNLGYASGSPILNRPGGGNPTRERTMLAKLPRPWPSPTARSAHRSKLCRIRTPILGPVRAPLDSNDPREDFILCSTNSNGRRSPNPSVSRILIRIQSLYEIEFVLRPR